MNLRGKRMRRGAGRLLGLCCALVCVSTAPRAADGRAEAASAYRDAGRTLQFTERPKVLKDGERWVMTFAVEDRCDVTVAIVGRDGRVVCHLASGVLGPNAPAPFQPGSLSQRLVWDGTDDRGRPAMGGPFAVRVSLGLTPRLDGFIGYNPQVIDSIRAMTVDSRGQLYVFNVVPNVHGGDGTTVCQVFGRTGRYVRTIMPYPANLTEQALRGLRRVQLPGGSRVPFIYQGETRSLYPGVGEIPRQRPVVTRDGRLAFVGIQEYGRYAQPGVNRLVVIHTDGSVPEGGILGPKLADRAASAASLALSPDQQWIYATGLYDGYRGTYWEKCKWHHVVYRFGWEDAEATPFLGTPYEAGSDTKHFNDPRSVATDTAGRLYVADRGNDRIAVFSAEGEPLGQIDVAKPSWVEVHPRTGAVYVLAGAPLNQLIKFSPFPGARTAARLELPNRIDRGRRHLWPVMALDASEDPPVVWVGAPSHYCEFGLLRIEDRGHVFGHPVDVTRWGEGPGVGMVTDMSLDRQGQRLYVRKRGFFDARTGKLLDIPPPQLSGSGPIACFGADGNFYVYEGYPDAMVRRYDAQMKPLPFGQAPHIAHLGSPRVHGRGMAVDEEGNLYVLYQKPEAKQRPGDARDANALNVYGADGQLKQEHLVDAQIRQIHSVRVDRQGNVYLAAGLRPGPHAGDPAQPPGDNAWLPMGLEKQLADLKPYKYRISPLEMNWYAMMYGSIIKFPPTGGLIREDASGIEARYGFGNFVRVQGALWIRGGVSNVPSWRTKGTPDVCLCVPVRFDVDRFGRVFYPDVCGFRIGVLDTAGNLMLHFGSYGNQDSAGHRSPIPEPGIAFAWPQIVAADSSTVYVADQLNRRIVRVRLAYAVEVTCPVR
ncbi:MAG TPA: hypothetical protein EYH34_04535 [Planctomycetes bacterium]|nr:hypothetical protein [Planctomycetota bacterium]